MTHEKFMAYEELHRELHRLMSRVVDRLLPQHASDISEFIDANEFGIALEWLLSTLAETGKTLSRSEFDLAMDLAKKMEMFPAICDRFPSSLVVP